MFFYEFPKIEKLNDILPAIQGRDEFIIADKGDYYVSNYNVNFSDSFTEVNLICDCANTACVERVIKKIKV